VAYLKNEACVKAERQTCSLVQLTDSI